MSPPLILVICYMRSARPWIESSRDEWDVRRDPLAVVSGSSGMVMPAWTGKAGIVARHGGE